jgi:hypothetical protein
MDKKMNEYMIMHSEIQLEIQLKEFGIIHKKKFLKKTKSHQQFFEREVKNFDDKLFSELFRNFNKKLNKPSEFKEYIQNIIQIQQQSYKSKSRKSNSRIHKKNSASSYTKTISRKKRPNFTENIFNNIIKDAYKRYKINDKDFEILKSEAPNNDGDITALIMSGNDVLHRRMSEKESVSDRWINLFNLQHPTKPTSLPHSTKLTSWRYLLNIYYHTNDLVEKTDELLEYTDDDLNIRLLPGQN